MNNMNYDMIVEHCFNLRNNQESICAVTKTCETMLKDASKSIRNDNDKYYDVLDEFKKKVERIQTYAEELQKTILKTKELVRPFFLDPKYLGIDMKCPIGELLESLSLDVAHKKCREMLKNLHELRGECNDQRPY